MIIPVRVSQAFPFLDFEMDAKLDLNKCKHKHYFSPNDSYVVLSSNENIFEVSPNNNTATQITPLEALDRFLDVGPNVPEWLNDQLRNLI